MVHKDIPSTGLLCSPLVPKPGNHWRLIHNLAWPYDENSINVNIPDEEAKVVYQSFNMAVKLGLKHGRTAHASKLDFNTAFRNFPIRIDNLMLLGFQIDEEFFINSSLAFGGRLSCKLFEEFATSIQWVLEQKTKSKDFGHYLDDFIMVHTLIDKCAYYMHTMEQLCKNIGPPSHLKRPRVLCK